MTKKLPDNQIIFYQSQDGSVNVEVLFAEEKIYIDGEVDQPSTCKDFLQVQDEGERETNRKKE